MLPILNCFRQVFADLDDMFMLRWVDKDGNKVLQIYIDSILFPRWEDVPIQKEQENGVNGSPSVSKAEGLCSIHNSPAKPREFYINPDQFMGIYRALEYKPEKYAIEDQEKFIHVTEIPHGWKLVKVDDV